MHGRTNALRFLSLIILTGLFGLTLSDLSDAAEQKDNGKKDGAAAIGSLLEHPFRRLALEEGLNESMQQIDLGDDGGV